MAANDYYNSYHPSHQDTSYHGASGRTNGPLPPVPASPFQRPYRPTVETHPPNPFDDRHHPSYSGTAEGRQGSPYYGQPHANGSRFSHNDPFGDSNAIPLQDQGKGNKAGAGGTSSPIEAEQDPSRRRSDKDRRRRRKKDGWFKGKITWACYILFLIQLGVFIAEIAKNAILTGSPIEIHPTFNPMIGPSPYVLINMGARFTPCMRDVYIDVKQTGAKHVAVTTLDFQCPNATTNDAFCRLGDLCGFGMNLRTEADGTIEEPNQWFRFITPIFLHGGLIHIGFNMLLQLTLGRDIERQIGTIRFCLVYFASGIFGNVFGGNFAPNGLPSTGASGCLFGIIALVLLDLLYTWKSRKSPGKDLLFIMLDIVISFVLGLLPALDNFAHIGGFLTGLALGICILHSPDSLRERIGLDSATYATVPHVTREGEEGPFDQKEDIKAFAKQPVGFFKGRKPLWWAWWLIRAGGLVLVVVAFALLLNNFYVNKQTCSWCKYLSCLPIKNWCDIGNLSTN